MSPDGTWLVPFHEQLLRVALVPSERTVEGWEQLRTRPELWGPVTSQLLPLLSRALVRAGVDDHDLVRLHRRAHRAWFDNQLWFRCLGQALQVLDAAGIRTSALKGIPLALRHYPDPSLRPMVDFDLLVDAEAAPDAIEALRRAGWGLERTLDTDFVARTSEVQCRSPDGYGVLDLHWRLVPWVGRTWAARDPALWQAATSLSVGDQVTLAPADHDLLLHVILHAYRSGWPRVPRWAADAVVLLRSSGDGFDWNRFVDRVCDARLALPIAGALEYVRGTFDAPVPESVLVALAEADATRREIRKYRVGEWPISARRHWLVGEAPDLRISWARISVNYSRTGALQSLAPFLRGRTHVDRVWTLPFAVALRRMRRLRTVGTPGEETR